MPSMQPGPLGLCRYAAAVRTDQSHAAILHEPLGSMVYLKAQRKNQGLLFILNSFTCPPVPTCFPCSQSRKAFTSQRLGSDQANCNTAAASFKAIHDNCTGILRHMHALFGSKLSIAVNAAIHAGRPAGYNFCRFRSCRTLNAYLLCHMLYCLNYKMMPTTLLS